MRGLGLEAALDGAMVTINRQYAAVRSISKMSYRHFNQRNIPFSRHAQTASSLHDNFTHIAGKKKCFRENVFGT